MKKTVLILVSFTALFISWSCAKPNNSVRFTNHFTETINNVKAGNAFFGSVDPGKTTDYLRVSTQSFLISGSSASFQQLRGSETVAKKGTHKYTITLTETGGLDFSED
ncbi:MAG TPA: hypothetical protein PL029_04665 [Bacteroidia bacterium]|nr:hypothetical protein [Bacteroidia bacterium]